MAYGTIIQFEYRDIQQVLTVVRIKQLDYAGSAEVRTSVNAGCEFAWGDSSNDLPVIYGSEAKVFIDSETDYEFLYLFSANARKHLVEIDKGGSLFWKGFIEPNSWSEPLIAAPYPVEFVAYDMMGFLDDLDFVDSNGDAFEGKMTLIELIQFILAQTSLELPVHTATDFVEFAQTASTDYFAQHSVNLEAFAGMSYLEVLRQVLTGHSIRQRAGKWWIISNSLKAGAGTISYYIYAAGSAASSGTSTTDLEDAGTWWIEDEADMELLPALRQLSVLQDYGYQENLLKNGNFQDYTIGGLIGKLSALKNWTIQDADVYIDRLDDDDVFLRIEGQMRPYYPNDIDEGVIHTGLEIEPGNGGIKLGFRYGLLASDNDETAYMFIRVTHTVGGTVYYLRQFGNSDTREMDYEWTTDGTDIRTAISLNSHYTSNYTGSGFLGARVNPDQVEGVTYDKIKESLKSFSAIMPAVPGTGTMQVALWKPWSSRTQVLGSVFANVNIEVLNANQESYVASEELTVINDVQNNFIPEDLEISVGTIPAISNNEIIYLGGLLRADGSAATTFKIGSSAWYSWSELQGRLAASAQRTPRRAWKGTFADLVPGLNLIITDPNNAALKLIETGITYNDHMASTDGQYVELLSVALSGFSTRMNQSADSKGGSSGSSGGSSLPGTQPIVVSPTPPAFGDITGLPTDNAALKEYLDRINDSAFADTETRLLSGSVLWDEGLTFISSIVNYKIFGIRYSAQKTTITLDAADATYDRIDVFYVDVFGNLNVKKGTPAALPIAPELAADELFVRDVLIPAGQTEPDGISVEQIYDDNIEWTTTIEQESGKTTVATADTTEPKKGTKHVSISIAVPDTTLVYPTHYIGERYQGGIIFWIDPLSGGKRGLIAAEEDIAEEVFWSRLSGHATYTTGATGLDIGTGAANTALMFANSAVMEAATYYDAIQEIAGYTGWFIGSQREMEQLWFRRNVVPGFGSARSYWTSTEYSWDRAVRINGDSGSIKARDKNDRRNIRPIREYDDTSLPATDPVEYYAPVSTSISFTGGAAIPVQDGILSLQSKSTEEWRSNSVLIFELYNGSSLVGRCAMSTAANLFGFKTGGDEYQLIAIQAANFRPVGDTFDKLTIRMLGSWPNNMSLYIDDVRWQYSDVEQAIPSTLPAGGDTGQVLTKTSEKDNEADWQFVAYDNIDSTLKGRITDHDGTWDLSAAGIVQATISTAVTVALSNLQENKAITVLLTLSTGGSLTLPSYCKLIDGSVDLSSSPDAGTYVLDFHCLIASSGSEFVRTSIGKVL